MAGLGTVFLYVSGLSYLLGIAACGVTKHRTLMARTPLSWCHQYIAKCSKGELFQFSLVLSAFHIIVGMALVMVVVVVVAVALTVFGLKRVAVLDFMIQVLLLSYSLQL